MQNNCLQRLYWSLSKPIKHMGLTLDEWFLAAMFGIPSIICLIFNFISLGCCLLITTGIVLSSVKKFKKLSQGFVVKSWMVAKNMMLAPKYYPNFKNKIVGR